MEKLARYGLIIDVEEDWTLKELRLVHTALGDFTTRANWTRENFRRVMTKSGTITVNLTRLDQSPHLDSIGGQAAGWVQNGYTENPIIVLFDGTFASGDLSAKRVIVHEIAHVWDNASKDQLSHGMGEATGGCNEKVNCTHTWFVGDSCESLYHPGTGTTGKETPASEYGRHNRWEDWAEAVAATIYPKYQDYVDTKTSIPWASPWSFSRNATRLAYVHRQFHDYRN